ncbi:MAG: 23S rRNA (guanosine(2251)-2'-O)-methyltransferase RlmB, partial [bacterium]|nr:23S rRNA (guanosine(2251)-2'-O)-methyltransferase RlmB [bacterium]
DRGLWILGTSEHANTDLSQIRPDRPWLLVLGNEEKGLRRLTLKKCDTLCRIPTSSRIPSLNISVAAGIFIHALTPTMT